MKILFYKKDVPRFSQIRTEVSNYCGCNCFMCPHSEMTRKKGFMSLDSLKIILREVAFIDYDCSFHLHGTGEPLLCKNLAEYISLVKTTNPFFKPLIITTLAYSFDENWFFNLFYSGLNAIEISLYGYDRSTYIATHGVDKFDLVKENLKILAKARNKYQSVNIKIKLDDFGDLYPAKIDKATLDKLRYDFISYLYFLGFSKDQIVFWKLHNFGNSVSNMTVHQYKNPCSILFGTRRNILELDWELNVRPCCFDFDSKYSWGNLKENSLESIYKSKKRKNFLYLISKGNKVNLCQGCPELGIENLDIKSNKFINSIAWWIPVRKWRDKFRAKFE